MVSTVNLSGESVSLLNKRGLSGEEINDFSALLKEAREELRQDKPAKEILSGMSKDEMVLLQKASGLADPILPNSLSSEGATNLLAHPDKSGMVDLNNDGIVEVGVARLITFPPVNAPASVHQAWKQATENMSWRDKMLMQLHLHTATYGVYKDGIPTKEPLPPEEQWSSAGWNELLRQLKGALDFAVSLDGWSRTNLVRRDFYNNFENALSQQADLGT